MSVEEDFMMFWDYEEELELVVETVIRPLQGGTKLRTIYKKEEV